MIRTENQRETSKLDKLFSQFIRLRAMIRAGGCERCGSHKKSYKDLDCAHNETRSKKSVRWNESNACGLCGGCHFYIDSHPLEKIEFFKKLLGEEYDLLQAQARIPGKPDKKLLEIYYTQKIKELEDGH